MKAKKATKQEKTERRAVPFVKIAKLHAEGKTVQAIAKAIGRYNEELPDPTKSVRAILSRMYTAGYVNEAGKVVKLKKRDRVAAKATTKAQGGVSGAKVRSKATPKPRKAQKAPESKGKAVEAKELVTP